MIDCEKYDYVNNNGRDEIILMEDGTELLRCLTFGYLHAFVEDHLRGWTDNLLVYRSGKSIPYKNDLYEGSRGWKDQ